MPKLGQLPLVQSLSIHEAAQILGVSTKTLRRWEKQKLIAPERTLGNQRRYRQDQLDVILRQRTISKLLIPAGVRKLFKLSSAQKFTLAGIVTLTLISASLLILNQIGIQYSFSLKLPQLKSDIHSQTSPNIPFPTGAVLAAQTSSGNLILKANIPTLIDSTATVSGNLTAPNIVYNLLEGTGIDITGDPQTPTISTTDQTTDLKIFSTFKVGSTDITAGSKTDTLTFVAGSNVSLSANTTDKKLTISASLTDPGWTDDGSIVRLSSASDSVSIGIATAEAKLNVFGQTTGKALALFNETGDQAIFTASAGGIPKFTIANSGQITSGSSNVTMTLATGFIDADALTLATSTDGTGPTSSFSGLEVYSDGLTLIQGCTNDQLLKWTDGAGWSCAGDNDSGATASFNFWQYSSTDGTLAPGNLTVDTLFGAVSTASAKLRVAGSLPSGQAAVIVNQTETQDIFTASASGSPRFVVDVSGNLLVPAASRLDTLTAGALNLGTTTATSLVLGSVTATNINFTSDASTRDDFTFTGGITGTTTLDVQGTSIGLNYDASVNNVLSFGTGPGAAGDDLYWGNSKVCESTSVTCGWATSAELVNFWQYNSADGTLAPGNLTVDTLFGSTATTSARLIVGGSLPAGKASVIVNQTESQDIFSASVSGTPRFTIGNSGNFTIPAQTSASSITSTQTTGNILSLADASASQTSNDFLNIAQTGVTTGYTGNLIDLSSTSTTGAATFFNLAADSSTVGTLMNLSGDALTSGNGLTIDSTSTGLTGSLLSLTSGSTAALTNGIFYLNATGAHTGNAFRTASATQTGTIGNFTGSAVTSGTVLDVTTSNNTLTTGNLLRSYSTATSLTTGILGYFNWEPSTVATSSGDLVRINIGNAGDTTGNLFNVTSAGSSLFSVSEIAITNALPTSFTAAGDVSLAYDLLFTNQTASYLKSNASLYIQAGETFESNNLTLTTYNSGRILGDTSALGGLTLSSNIYAVTPQSLLQVNGASTGKALVVFNETGNQAPLTASISGTTKFSVDSAGLTNINFNGTVEVNAVCHSGADIDAASNENRTLVACNPGTLTDYAEWYPTENNVDFGEVVVMGDTEVTVNAGDGYGKYEPGRDFQISKLKKSNTPYQKIVVGVVSKNFSELSSLGKNVVGPEHHPLPIALNGRVPVKVSSENGPIQAGDYLTTSSTPGIAMKATKPGFTIGKALSDYAQSGIGEIMIFVNNSWIDPNNSLAFDESGNLARLVTLQTPTPTPTPAPVDSPPEASAEEGQTILTSLKVNQSAEIGVDLRVFGQLQVAGALTVTGETNFMGTVFFNKDTAGFAVIPTGARSVTITYDHEYLQPPIVTTNPVWDTNAAILGAAIDQPVSLLPKQDYIIAASTATGFTILLEQPAVIDLKFTWTALAIKDPRTVSAPAPTPPVTVTPPPSPTPTP